ncbi:MAG: YitT family protein [Bacteroidaceae bacterium]|nr:YitT family protein [Bacteroidaceae bacterium]MBQ6800749.1 YitT family protein [Bacteroidaceae bacterium]MBR6589332.1 YitT family protein [Bacteroidaceae bacterium]
MINRMKLWRETKDYLVITLGLMAYAMGWCLFLLPYQISTGGVTGISAIIYYATGVEMQISYFLINAAFLAVALYILGLKFCLKTIFSVVVLTFFLDFFQEMMKDDAGNLMQIIGPGQDFMACVIGSIFCGAGIASVFIVGGSTGGTDIIAAIVNKYKAVTFGRMIMVCDIIIISSCYFVFEDWRRVVFGFVTLIIISVAIDYIVNSARQSVQFLIFSKKYEEIGEAVMTEVNRGVTVLDGTGFYSKQPVKVLCVLAKKSEAIHIFRLVKDIDPNAFISQSNVVGVYGEGFDQIKVKSKKK